MLSADATVVVQFYDIDPMNVVWHGNYPRFLELARRALLARIGYDYADMRQSGFAWPVVDMRLKYVRPIHLGDTIIITASLLEYEHRLKLGFRIRAAGTGVVLTKAHSTQVAVSLDTGALMLESPRALIEKVEALTCGGA